MTYEQMKYKRFSKCGQKLFFFMKDVVSKISFTVDSSFFRNKFTRCCTISNSTRKITITNMKRKPNQNSEGQQVDRHRNVHPINRSAAALNHKNKNRKIKPTIDKKRECQHKVKQKLKILNEAGRI